MRNYKVHFEHETRRELHKVEHVFIEHVEIEVEASDGEEAVKRSREIFSQPTRWKVRCIVIL